MARLFKRRSRAGRRARQATSVECVVITLLALFTLLPIVYMVSTAFKLPEDAFDLRLIPQPGTLENFARVIYNYGFGNYFVNSLIVAGSAAIFTRSPARHRSVRSLVTPAIRLTFSPLTASYFI